MADYKGFDLNVIGTPPPWGAREVQAFQDIIDTMVADTLDEKDVTGHKHTKVYNGSSQAILDANNVDGLVNMGGSTQRIDIRVRETFVDAFRLRTDSGDIINVDTSSGNKRVTIGAPGVDYPITMTSVGDVYTRPWQEISSKCTFNGFLDLDPILNKVWIRQIGGLVFVQLNIQGTSDNPYTSITFPFVMQGSCTSASFYGFDYSGEFNLLGYYEDSTSVLLTKNYFGNNNFWMYSGVKGLSGSFIVSVTDPEFTL